MTILSLAQAASPTIQGTNVWTLFQESFDVFTIILIVGSFGGVALITRLAMDARASVIAPEETPRRIGRALDDGKPDDAARIARDESGIVGDALAAAHSARGAGASAMREAAELAASAACARWTRPLEFLKTIGELGPLVGLAGTVWGMILAFVRLGQAGGAAGPTDLSLGISKALFHTLLGLMLAIPCLLIAAWFRGIIEKHCNSAFSDAGALVDRLAALESEPKETKPR